MPPGSFGHELTRFYAVSGFSFPGEPDPPTEQFTTPHDFAHVLSGYDTSVQGELLVSTFTAGMHHLEGLAGHILPVMVIWQLGIPLTELAGSTTGALDARKQWVAWTRGDATTADTFSSGWDFWAHVDKPLEELRAAMDVPRWTRPTRPTASTHLGTAPAPERLSA